MNLKKLFRKTIPNEWALSNLWHQKSRKCKMWCLLFRAANCISDVVMNSCWNGKGENAHLEEKKRGREREREREAKPFKLTHIHYLLHRTTLFFKSLSLSFPSQTHTWLPYHTHTPLPSRIPILKPHLAYTHTHSNISFSLTYHLAYLHSNPI